MESVYIWVGNNKEGWVRWLIPKGIVWARNRTTYTTIQDKDFVLSIGKSYIIIVLVVYYTCSSVSGLVFWSSGFAVKQKLHNDSKSVQGKK